MPRRKKSKKLKQRVVSQEQRELEMREYLLADSILFENSLKILQRRFCLTHDTNSKQEIGRKIQTVNKKKENRLKYLTLLEPIFELTDMLKKEDLSEPERAYFTKRRKNLRNSLKEDRLYTLIWDYHEKLNRR